MGMIYLVRKKLFQTKEGKTTVLCRATYTATQRWGDRGTYWQNESLTGRAGAKVM